MEAYCLVCKSKKEIRFSMNVTTKSGRPAVSGLCAGCSNKIIKIGKNGSS